MSGVPSEVLSPVNHKSLAAEQVDSQRDALMVDLLLGAFSKVFRLLEAVGVDDAFFEHFSVLLAEFGVLLRIWLKIFFPK